MLVPVRYLPVLVAIRSWLASSAGRLRGCEGCRRQRLDSSKCRTKGAPATPNSASSQQPALSSALTNFFAHSLALDHFCFELFSKSVRREVSAARNCSRQWQAFFGPSISSPMYRCGESYLGPLGRHHKNVSRQQVPTSSGRYLSTKDRVVPGVCGGQPGCGGVSSV